MAKENLEKITEVNLLYDFYGELLPQKQQELFRLHREDDFSLAEIGAELGITRQGVHDHLRRAENSLRDYEAKLGLARRFRETERSREAALRAIDALIAENPQNTALTARLTEIKDAITE